MVSNSFLTLKENFSMTCKVYEIAYDTYNLHVDTLLKHSIELHLNNFVNRYNDSVLITCFVELGARISDISKNKINFDGAKTILQNNNTLEITRRAKDCISLIPKLDIREKYDILNILCRKPLHHSLSIIENLAK